MTGRSAGSVPDSPRQQPVEPFSVSFTLALDDYVETLLWMHRRPDMQAARTKRVFRDLLLTAPVIALAIAAVVWAMGSAWLAAAPFVVTGGIFGSVVGAFGLEASLRRLRVRRGIVKELRATHGVDLGDDMLRQAARVTVTDEGIESWTPSLEMRRPWNVLLGLDETDRMLLPRTGQARWIMIPKRELPPEVVERLRRLIRRQLHLPDLGGAADPASPPPGAS